MNAREKINLLLSAARAIFASKRMDTDITQVILNTNAGNFGGRWFVNKMLRGFDFAVNDGGKQKRLRILEQNPNKVDQFGNLKENAILARQGHQICWVISLDTNEFLGKIVDGKWTKNEPRATYQANWGASGAGAATFTRSTAQDQYGRTYQQHNGGWSTNNGLDIPNVPPEGITEHIMNLPDEVWFSPEVGYDGDDIPH